MNKIQVQQETDEPVEQKILETKTNKDEETVEYMTLEKSNDSVEVKTLFPSGSRVNDINDGRILLCWAIAQAAPGERKLSIDKIAQIAVTLSIDRPAGCEEIMCDTQGSILILDNNVQRGSL